MSTVATTDRISHLRDLLGPAVLLPWASGSKGDSRRWKHLQLADMDDVSHLTKLHRAGNIGVALGQVSNGLVTIDFDQDSYAETFLTANPLLADTLRTRGRRGCNIWVRCSSAYPESQKVKNSAGDQIGEWRADANQTIVAGTHPDGMQYRFVIEEPVITISYGAIIWPESIVAPRATESRRVRRVRRAGEKEVVSVGVCFESELQIQFAPDVIAQIAPTACRRNNASLFKLARLVKTYEKAIGRSATTAELNFVFDRWSLIARRFWRPGRSRDDYYAEFLEAYHYARIGLDENPLELAASRAKAAPLPQLEGFTDERVRFLAAICREMQRITIPDPFFLPTRKLGAVLGIHWTKVAQWLRGPLEVLEIIHLAPGEVRKRGGDRSPRYHYGPSGQACQICASPRASTLHDSHVLSTSLALPARA